MDWSPVAHCAGKKQWSSAGARASSGRDQGSTSSRGSTGFGGEGSHAMVCERIRSPWRLPEDQADAMVMLGGAAHAGRRRSVVRYFGGAARERGPS